MYDLAEHVGVILWITSGLLSVCGILIALHWSDMRSKVREAKTEAAKFTEWFKKIGIEHGGLVTRDLHFEWCKDQQSRCPACGGFKVLTDWRNGMSEKGGVMTRNEHVVIDKEVTRDMTELLCERMEEFFKQHRTWVAQELKIVRLEIAKGRLTGGSEESGS